VIRRKKSASALVAASVAMSVLVGAPARATTRTTLTATADTFVSSSRPTRAYGATPTLEVDGSPTKQVLVAFDLSGVGGVVTSARLRLFQVDSAPTGGRVHEVSGAWSETTTWNTRPAIDGQHLGTFGSVKSGNWYEIDVTSAVIGNEGNVSFAIDSTSSN
jgi:hypothetical protein